MRTQHCPVAFEGGHRITRRAILLTASMITSITSARGGRVNSWGYVRSTVRRESAYTGTFSSAPSLDDAAPWLPLGHGGGGGLQSTQAPSPFKGAHSARRHPALHPGPKSLPHSQVQRTRRHPGRAPQRSQGGGRLPLGMVLLHTCVGTVAERPQVIYDRQTRACTQQGHCTSCEVDCTHQHLLSVDELVFIMIYLSLMKCNCDTERLHSAQQSDC